MFGGGIVWFYRKLAGMNDDTEKPGYRHIIFKPQPAGDIINASYSNLTPYGNASINWKKERDKFIIDIRVPVSCTATVYVPGSKASKVKEGGRKIKRANGITFLGIEEGYAVYKVNSGNYIFESGL